MFQLIMCAVCYVGSFALLAVSRKSTEMWTFLLDNEKRVIALVVVGSCCMAACDVFDLMYRITAIVMFVSLMVLATVCLALEAGRRRYTALYKEYARMIHDGFAVYIDNQRILHPSAKLVMSHTVWRIDWTKKEMTLRRN